jgi:hypothetical protein
MCTDILKLISPKNGVKKDSKKSNGCVHDRSLIHSSFSTMGSNQWRDLFTAVDAKNLKSPEERSRHIVRSVGQSIAGKRELLKGYRKDCLKESPQKASIAPIVAHSSKTQHKPIATHAGALALKNGVLKRVALCGYRPVCVNVELKERPIKDIFAHLAKRRIAENGEQFIELQRKYELGIKRVKQPLQNGSVRFVKLLRNISELVFLKKVLVKSVVRMSQSNPIMMITTSLWKFVACVERITLSTTLMNANI